MASAIQIVLSRLRRSEDRDTFLELTRQMVAWLSAQPGFVHYELYESKDGWADRIEWASIATAAEGNRAFAATEIFRRLMEIVDPDYRGIVGRVVDLSLA
jgi:quinol monooxygenase YgiN